MTYVHSPAHQPKATHSKAVEWLTDMSRMAQRLKAIRAGHEGATFELLQSAEDPLRELLMLVLKADAMAQASEPEEVTWDS